MTRYRYVRRCCPGAFCVSTPNKMIVLVAVAPFDIAQDRVPMIGLVLVTHGRLADEFRAALEHVMGPQKQIEAITIGAEDDSDLCRSDIIEAVNRVDSGDGVAILTDMFGGTPSNLAISCMTPRWKCSQASIFPCWSNWPKCARTVPCRRLSTWPRRPVANTSPSPAACLRANEGRGEL